MQNTLPRYPVEAVANALQLLLEFRERPSIGVAETSRLLGVARSTAHRLLAMLAHYEFVVQNEHTRAYHAGPALVALGELLGAPLATTLLAKGLFRGHPLRAGFATGARCGHSTAATSCWRSVPGAWRDSVVHSILRGEFDGQQP